MDKFSAFLSKSKERAAKAKSFEAESFVGISWKSSSSSRGPLMPYVSMPSKTVAPSYTSTNTLQALQSSDIGANLNSTEHDQFSFAANEATSASSMGKSDRLPVAGSGLHAKAVSQPRNSASTLLARFSSLAPAQKLTPGVSSPSVEKHSSATSTVVPKTATSSPASPTSTSSSGSTSLIYPLPASMISASTLPTAVPAPHYSSSTLTAIPQKDTFSSMPTEMKLPVQSNTALTKPRGNNSKSRDRIDPDGTFDRQESCDVNF
jgi:hypothetical protein